VKLALLLILAASARAADMGGHSPVEAEKAAPAEDRGVILDEMWTRRLITPDQTTWSPGDLELLAKIRASENDALAYLKKKYVNTRPWTAPSRAKAGIRLLTKDGYDKYLFNLSQDAIEYFENKGAGAKWALKLTDWDGKRLFDPDGRLTPAGVTVYTRAKLKLETYWKSPNGEVFGTRRPPK
jgi:hypothetical protein